MIAVPVHAAARGFSDGSRCGLSEREREHRLIPQAVVGEHRCGAEIVDEPVVELDDLAVRGKPSAGLLRDELLDVRDCDQRLRRVEGIRVGKGEKTTRR